MRCALVVLSEGLILFKTIFQHLAVLFGIPLCLKRSLACFFAILLAPRTLSRPTFG
jgi:hypothetical protein